MPAGPDKRLSQTNRSNPPPVPVTPQVLIPTVPNDVTGVVPWSQSEGRFEVERDRWWLGVGVFTGCAALLFLLQIVLLGQSGFLWFVASLGIIGGGLAVHRTMRDGQRLKEMAARTQHNLNQAHLVATQINQAAELSDGMMSLELPIGSQDADQTVVTFHGDYLLVSQFESNHLQLVWASEIEDFQTRKLGIGTTGESKSSFSSHSSSSATISGDHAYGSGSTYGSSHGKSFQEDVYNHKIVISTRNSMHPVITLDFLEDEEMWDFCAAALKQMANRTANFNQTRVRLKAPELNRSIGDLRRWFASDGDDTSWSKLPIPMKIATVLGSCFLLAMFAGPVMQFILGVAVLPALAINFPLISMGLTDAQAAIAGLAAVLTVVGCVSFIPAVRGKLDGLLRKKPLRPVLAAAISWPVLGQLAVCTFVLAARQAAVPPNVVAQQGAQGQVQANGQVPANGQAPQGGQQAQAARANQPPRNPEQVLVENGQAAWKNLLVPGTGWKGQVTHDVKVTPARITVLDASATGEYVVAVESDSDDQPERGVFGGKLETVGLGADRRVEFHAKPDQKGPAWPLNYLFETIALRIDGQKLIGSHGLIVTLDQPVQPVLWKKEDLRKRLHDQFRLGSQFTGFESPRDKAAIDGRLIVTELKNNGQTIELMGTADSNSAATVTYKGSFREDGVNLWGYPILAVKPNGHHGDYHLPQETGSGLFSHNESHLYAGWRTDGKLVVWGGVVPFNVQKTEQLPDFKGTSERNLAVCAQGSVWQGSWYKGDDPALDVTLTITEVRNQGAYVRAQLTRNAAPFEVELLVGKLDPSIAGYALKLDRKQGARNLYGYEHLNLRFDPLGKCIGYTNHGATLSLSAQPRTGSPDAFTTAKMTDTLKQAFAQPRKYKGKLTKASDGNSVDIAVEFAPKTGNVIQAAISIPNGPKGRILYEGSLVTTDEAVNGYCLIMKKKSTGLDNATSMVFNNDSEAQLWFRMDQGLQQVVGIAGDEYLILE